MPPLMRLPGYEVPRNALLDLSPINNAITSYRQQQNQDRQFGLQQEGMELQQKQFGLAQDRAARERENEIKTRMGNAAVLALMEPDEAKRAAMHQSIFGLHPDAKSLPDTYKDPRTGLLAIVGDAGMADRYLQAKFQREQVARAEAAQARAAELHPYQVTQAKVAAEGAGIDLEAKRRNLQTPPLGKVELKPGEQTIFYDTRTGEQKGVLGTGLDPNLGPYKDAKQKADVEESLRKEVTSAAKDYNTIRDASSSLESISKAPSAASDIAMVFSFMKILDPGSVVRETEYATAARAAGVPERVVGVIEKIQSGQFLTPSQRADFLSVAQTMAKSREVGYRSNLERYRGISQRIGVDARNVIPEDRPPTIDPRQTTTTPQRAVNPATGEILELRNGQWVPADPLNPKTYDGPAPPASR
jgi:hypothetical protein